MEKNQDYIDELIGKELAGEALPGEIMVIDSWANESEANRKYVDQCKVIFEQSAAVKEMHAYDTDAAWNNIRKTLAAKETRVVSISRHEAPWSFSWRIAASIVVVLGIGFFAYSLLSPRNMTPVVVASATDVVTDTLPDGSDVVLNKGTTLKYAYDKRRKTHEVKLVGEAYFNVHHDKTKSFIIDVEGVFIRDIGTSFNVKAYPESNTIEVVVESGEVMFYTENDSGVYLRANGKGIYNKVTKTFTIDQPELNVLAYKTKFFSFTDTDLSTVASALNGVYLKKIVLDERLRNCHLTVSFNNESQAEIVAVIAETLGLTVQETGDQIMLSGPGCVP